MKKEYVIPTIEIIDLKNEDIITTSGGGFDPDDLLNQNGDPWYVAP